MEFSLYIYAMEFSPYLCVCVCGEREFMKASSIDNMPVYFYEAMLVYACVKKSEMKCGENETKLY